MISTVSVYWGNLKVKSSSFPVNDSFFSKEESKVLTNNVTGARFFKGEEGCKAEITTTKDNALF